MGQQIEWPVILAPTGMSRLFHHDGELAACRAAAAAGTLYCASTMAADMIPRARKVAFIGFGSIGSAAARHLTADEGLQSRWRLAGVLTRTGVVPGALRAYGSLAEILEDSPDLVVECAC